MKAAGLYDADFYEWTIRNARALRAGRVREADLPKIAEEIEDMGKRERRALMSRAAVLVQHLMKWQLQPDRRGTSWQSTIRAARKDVRGLLDESPSLRRALSKKLADVHEEAAFKASSETGIPDDDFLAACRFTLEQILDDSYLP